MKIYLFHPETGFYLGEDFTDETQARGGEPVIPPDATTIAPPVAARGEVPVFDPVKKSWEVLALPRGAGPMITATGAYCAAAPQ